MSPSTGLRFLNDSTTTGGGRLQPDLSDPHRRRHPVHLVSNSIFWSSRDGGPMVALIAPSPRPVIADGQITLTGNLISVARRACSAPPPGAARVDRWRRGAVTASGNIIEWSRTGLTLDMVGGVDRHRQRQHLPQSRHRFAHRQASDTGRWRSATMIQQRRRRLQLPQSRHRRRLRRRRDRRH
jgi:hypothetical protein